MFLKCFSIPIIPWCSQMLLSISLFVFYVMLKEQVGGRYLIRLDVISEKADSGICNMQ